MSFLGKQRKEGIFRLAVSYGVRANAKRIALHSLVGVDIGHPVWWTQHDGLPVTVSIVGGTELNGAMGVQVTTAPCKEDPCAVSLAYAHDLGHVVLDHYEEGSFVIGMYTRREAEADAFAYAYLYVTAATRTPCGGTLRANDIVQAFKSIYADVKGYYWSVDDRIEDNRLINAIWNELREEMEQDR